jgi:hypothetical protein
MERELGSAAADFALWPWLTGIAAWAAFSEWAHAGPEHRSLAAQYCHAIRFLKAGQPRPGANYRISATLPEC